MKNKKFKKLGMVLALITAIVLASGCSSDSKVSQQPFTEEEEAKFVEQFASKVLKPEEPSVIIEDIENNIDRVSKQEASNMVDGLLYVMHQQNPEMNTKVQGLQTAFEQLDKDNIDVNDAENLDKVKDETTKAFLKEAQKKKFIIEKVGQDYLPRPDIQFVINKYGKYMNDDLKAMAEFSLEENKKPFFFREVNNFDMNIVVGRILKIEENMKQFPKSFYLPAMESSKHYYYQVYFGTNNSFLVDENKVVIPAIVDHYKDTVTKHPDSQIAKDAQTVLDKLKETNNKVTDDIYVYLLELTGTQTTDVQDTSKINEKTNTEVNEVLQQAIKDNK